MSACASSTGVRVAEAPAAISNEHATPVLSRVPGWNKFMYRMTASVMSSMTAMSVLSAITTAALRLPATSAQSRLEMIMFTATACWLGDRLGVELGVGLGVEVDVGLGVELGVEVGVGLAVGLGVGLPGVGLGCVGVTHPLFPTSTFTFPALHARQLLLSGDGSNAASHSHAM